MTDADAAYLESEYGDLGEGDWPPGPPRYARRPWLAVALSVLVPGLGHVYVGDLRRGLRLWSAVIALLVLSGWAGLLDRFWGLVAVLVAAVGVYAYTLRDAAARARRLERFAPEPYNRWWVYAAVVLFANAVVAPGALSLLPGQTFAFPSSSMEPAVRAGDHLYARNGSFGAGDLQRGDVVLFRVPENPGVSRMFRVVALQGEEIDLVNKVVHVDREPLEEPYVRFVDPRTYPDAPAVPADLRVRDQFGPYRVPEGTVFVLGDNRDRSYDSRFTGPVPITSVHAKALYVYWSSLFGWQPDLSRIGETIE